MNELLELLNQFEKEKKSGYTWNNIDSYDNCVYGVDSDGETEITMYSDLYSKHYGFIEWLVQNGKIDFSNLKISELTSGTDLFYSFSETEVLLMLLSIQDNPIGFLISILK